MRTFEFESPLGIFEACMSEGAYVTWHNGDLRGDHQKFAELPVR